LGVGLNSYISDYKNLQFMVSKDPVYVRPASAIADHVENVFGRSLGCGGNGAATTKEGDSMGSLKEIRSKAIALVQQAKKVARGRPGFAEDLDAEFDGDPAAFHDKYVQYLQTLSDTEVDVLRDQAP